MDKNINEKQEQCTIHSVIVRFFKIIILYFKVAIIGKKQIKGYEFKEFGNMPITGKHHYMGYEIINPITNKVVYRRTKDWGVLGYSVYNWEDYNTHECFFPNNAL